MFIIGTSGPLIIISNNVMLSLSLKGFSLFILPSGYRAADSFWARNVSCSRTLQQNWCSLPSHAVSLATRCKKKQEDKLVISSWRAADGPGWPVQEVLVPGNQLLWKSWEDWEMVIFNRLNKRFKRSIWPLKCDGQMDTQVRSINRLFVFVWSEIKKEIEIS